MSESSDIKLLPRHCVACAYDLRSSPDDGRCPKCGARYEPGSYTWIWRQESRPSNGFVVENVIFLILMILVLLNLRSVRELTNTVTAMAVSILFGMWTLAAIVVIYIHLFMPTPPPAYASIEPKGVRYRYYRHGGPPLGFTVEEFVPWERITKIMPSGLDPICKLRLIGPPDDSIYKDLCDVTIACFASRAEALKFVELAQQRKLDAELAQRRKLDARAKSTSHDPSSHPAK